MMQSSSAAAELGSSATSVRPSGAMDAETSPQGRYIRLFEHIGSGSYKEVWKAVDTDEGVEVAWNVVKLSKIPESERKRIKNEVKLLKSLSHPNILGYHSSWINREREEVIFVTEIMSSGSLKENVFVRWSVVKQWCRQILAGLVYLHSNNIVHRDLKCGNIFINGSTGDIRIGDLGLSILLVEGREGAAVTCLGTPEFMAPEMYDEKYDEKIDIYAFGMCVAEMITQKNPYNGHSAAQIYKKVVKQELPPEILLIPRTDAREFVLSCVRHSSSDRPSAAELLNSSFLSSDIEADSLSIEIGNSEYSLLTSYTVDASLIARRSKSRRRSGLFSPLLSGSSSGSSSADDEGDYRCANDDDGSDVDDGSSEDQFNDARTMMRNGSTDDEIKTSLNLNTVNLAGMISSEINDTGQSLSSDCDDADMRLKMKNTSGDVITVSFSFHDSAANPDIPLSSEKLVMSSSSAGTPSIDVCAVYEQKISEFMSTCHVECDELNGIIQEGRIKSKRIQDAYLESTRTMAAKQKKVEEEFERNLQKINEKKSHLELQIQNIKKEMAARIEQLDSQIACAKA